jgi:hypothetical protein
MTLLSRPIRCLIGLHHWVQLGRSMPWANGMILLRRCERCGRVAVTRFEEYPEIDPPLPWSEAELRAALQAGTADMGPPARRASWVDSMLRQARRYGAVTGADDESALRLMGWWSWSDSSTGAPVQMDESLTFTQTHSKPLPH